MFLKSFKLLFQRQRVEELTKQEKWKTGLFQRDSQSHTQNQTLLAACSDQLGCSCAPPRICASSTEHKCETWLHIDESSYVCWWCRASHASFLQNTSLSVCSFVKATVTHTNTRTQNFFYLIVSHLLPPLLRNPQSPLAVATTSNRSQLHTCTKPSDWQNRSYRTCQINVDIT